jgi:hypothetical protein
MDVVPVTRRFPPTATTTIIVVNARACGSVSSDPDIHYYSNKAREIAYSSLRPPQMVAATDTEPAAFGRMIATRLFCSVSAKGIGITFAEEVGQLNNGTP